MPVTDTDFWTDAVRITDSTPVPRGMSRPTVRRSDLAGWAGHGCCASHSRFCWGLRLYPVRTPTGTPITWAPANPEIGEREALAAMLEDDADLVAVREAIPLITDKGFAAKSFEKELAERGVELLRPSRTCEKQRHGEPMLKKVRQLIESVNDPLKGQLDLEHHDGRTFEGVAVRVAQRVLAMAAAIWHNHQTGAPITRSLIAYDH
ncbi:transposase [Streptosporangium canum]